jgi:hypothetical protein
MKKIFYKATELKNCALALGLLFAFNTQAQLEIGVTVTPNLATFYSPDSEVENAYILRTSFGLNANYHLGRLSLSSGVMHLSQGQKIEVLRTTVNNPEGTNGETDDWNFKINTLALPLVAKFKFYDNQATSFFIGAGAVLGYIHSQKFENTGIPENNQVPRAEFREDLEVFNDFYFGLNGGIGWRQKLTQNLYLQVSPFILYQLGQGTQYGLAYSNPDMFFTFKQRMLTYGLELGIFYRL